MKFREFKKVMAVAMAFSTLAPSAVYAAEPAIVAEKEIGNVTSENEETNKEQGYIPEKTPETSEDSQTAKPEQPDVPVIPDTPPETPDIESPDAEVPDTGNSEAEPETKPENPDIPPVEEPESPDVLPENPEGENQEVAPPSEPEQQPGEVPEAEPEVQPEQNTEVPNVEDIPDVNPELQESQSTTNPPVFQPSFTHELSKKPTQLRFFTVARRYAFAKTDVELKEEMNTTSRTIGTLADKGVCFLLKEEGDWYYVESGSVRGFLPKTAVVTGAQANHILREYKEMDTFQDTIESVAPVAQETVPSSENNAYFYNKATTKQTVVDKVYAISTASTLNVREGKGTDSRIIGTLPSGTLCYILADQDDQWIYIESDNVRGFVSRNYIRSGEEVNAEVAEKGEDCYAKASEKIKPEENKAFYYTHTSVKLDAPTSAIREEIVEYASQFIGNPYVWGGTDPVNGADCSGFVQTIYRTYGIELPRVAADQAYAGEQIPVSEAQPGDLIFYKNSTGYIHHVVMYAGDGKTVEAKGRAYGIVSDDVSSTACWAVRLFEDEKEFLLSGDINEVNATEDMYGESLGEFDITYYCACEKCCDVETGLTATGTQVIEGQTIAVDPNVIPYGTQVIIGGHVFTAEDCGGAIKENRIDIYVNSHEKALELGRNNAEVFLVK